MRCFNCGNNIKNDSLNNCEYCGAIFSETKNNFISYIGPYGNLAGYNKSYKILLLKYIFENLNDDYTANVNEVVSRIRDFYLKRYERGLLPDYNVDSRIANIKDSSLDDVFAVIKSQPYRVINEKGFLFIYKKSSELVFTFSPSLINSFNEDERKKIIDILNSKLIAYYNKYDNITSKANIESGMDNIISSDNKISRRNFNSSFSPSTKIRDIDELSVRAKHVLGRNNIYTIGQLSDTLWKTDIMSFRNMGIKTYTEIVELLNSTMSNMNATKESEPWHNNSTDKNDFEALSVYSTISISDIPHISERTKNVLKRNSIHTVSDLIELGKISKLPNIGAKSISEIKMLLNRLSHIYYINDNNTIISNIHPYNTNLSIEMLLFTGISQTTINILHNNNIMRIGDIEKLTFKELKTFLSLDAIDNIANISEKISKPIINYIDAFFNNVVKPDAYNIYIARADGSSLQDIGNLTAKSRERVRQVEAKTKAKVTPGVFAIVHDQYLKNNNSYIRLSDLKNTYSENTCKIIKHTLNSTKNMQYISSADIYIESNQDVKADLQKIAEEFVGDGILFLDHINDLETLLSEHGYDYITTDEFLDFLIENKAYRYGIL